MHYRNGKKAKNGGRCNSGNIECIGILRDALPGNDYCNGYIQLGKEPAPSYRMYV